MGSGSEDLIIRINSILKNEKGVGIILPNFYRIIETAGKYKKFYTCYQRNSKFIENNILYPNLNKNIKFLWLSNPNPMIGKVINKKELVKLIRKHISTLFIIDESAIDFIKNQNKFSLIGYAQRLNNLIVIRSFSKFYGLAGLRVGFAVGKTTFLNKIKNIGLTFPVSKFADYFVQTVLKERNLFKKMRRDIENNKLKIKNLLSRNPDIVFNESITNCLFFGYKRTKKIYSELLKFGVISLNLDKHHGLKERRVVRITVPSSKDLYNDLFSRLSNFVKLINKTQ